MRVGAAHHETTGTEGTTRGDETPVMSFAQRRIWFMDRLAGGSSDALLPLAVRLEGDLDIPALERSLRGILERHEILRTRYPGTDGDPTPHVEDAGRVVLEHTTAVDVDEFFARELGRPIDPAGEPPVRMVLARTAPREHVLLVIVHHIAVDGWSWNILLRELAAGYRGEPVSPPRRRYADFARDERRRLTGPRMERLLDYWRGRLAGLTPLELPTDRPRPAFWDGEGDVVRFALSTEVVADVDRVAREHRATRYMVLLAVYQALLAHRSGRTDIAVCSTMTDRGRPGAEEVVGPFVNTLVLRNDLSGGPGFGALLERVRGNVLQDLSRAEAPFDRVVGEVVTGRDMSRHPLAQASFTLLNAGYEPLRLPGLRAELLPAPLAGSPLDVFLDLGLLPDGRIAARLQYATALFDRATMEDFAASYTRLLRAVLADRTTPVAELARRSAPTGATDPAVTAAAPAPVVRHRTPVRLWGGGGSAVVCGDRVVSYGELEGLSG
ncbi:condensation domain-containing protein, partial [Streptomyces calidiresistens]